MSSPSRLKVGIVGYGEIARFHSRHLLAAGADVVGIVTRRPDTGLTVYPSLASMLPHVDAITIAVPNHLHASLCAEAVVAGKAVLVEKPLCVTTAECRMLEALLPSASVPVHVGFRLRWNPQLLALRRRVHRLRRVRCVYRIGIDRLAAGKDWTRRMAESGGAFLAIGVHSLDLARWLAGARDEPLGDLRATANHRDGSAEYALSVSMQGVLPGGIEIVAAADLRGAAPFGLEIEIDAAATAPSEAQSDIAPEDERAAEVEYQGLIGDFVRAAREGDVDDESIVVALQVHRELLSARMLTESA